MARRRESGEKNWVSLTRREIGHEGPLGKPGRCCVRKQKPEHIPIQATTIDVADTEKNYLRPAIKGQPTGGVWALWTLGNESGLSLRTIAHPSGTPNGGASLVWVKIVWLHFDNA